MGGGRFDGISGATTLVGLSDGCGGLSRGNAGKRVLVRHYPVNQPGTNHVNQ